MAAPKQTVKKATTKTTTTTAMTTKSKDEMIRDKQREKSSMPVPVEFKALEIVQKRIREIRQFIAQGLLEKGIDYGRIPGVDKDMIFKTGCEMLLLNYGIVVDPPEIEDKGDFEKGLFRFRIIIRGYEKETRTYVGMGVASINSLEPKYRYRWLSSYKLTDPMRKMGINHETGKFDPEVLKDRWIAEHGEHAFRWATFKGNSIPQWRIENPEPYELENTLLKQGVTRALRALTLMVTGADRLFVNEKDLEYLGLAELDDVDFVNGEYKEVEQETGEITTSETPITKKSATPAPTTQKATSEPAIKQTEENMSGEVMPAPAKLSSPTIEKKQVRFCPIPGHGGTQFIEYPTSGGGTTMAHKVGVGPDGKKIWCLEKDALRWLDEHKKAAAEIVKQPSLLGEQPPNDMDLVSIVDDEEYGRVLGELLTALKYGDNDLQKFIDGNYPNAGATASNIPHDIRRTLLKDLYALVKSGLANK